MDIYKIHDIGARIADNPYVGRGIVIGKSEDGRSAVVCYFIMGRSENSRNRIFKKREGALFTEPYDPSLVSDPSLIIYAAMREHENRLIVTNGDQTDTVFEGLLAGRSLADSLRSRAFEPDAPNLTPRISGLLTFSEGDFAYEMSILKSADAEGTACARYYFEYPALPGLGHFIHTYETDGNPLPTFQGEPERVRIPNDIDELTASLWAALNEENKISLYVSYRDLATGEVTERLLNKKEEKKA